MATKHIAHQQSQIYVCSLLDDFCKSPTVPAGYYILQALSESTNEALTVHARGSPVLTMRSRLTSVTGDEAGVGGGVVSQVNKGYCRPIKDQSMTVRAEGVFVVRHDTMFDMNCAGPDGPGNTIGRLSYAVSGPPAPAKLVILIGGGGDGSTGMVKDHLKDAVDKVEPDSTELAYFSWLDEQAAVDKINQFKAANPGGQIEIIGHSYGGDTALDVCETLNNQQPPVVVDQLTTLDPVSSFDPDQIFGSPKTDNIKHWDNVYVEGYHDYTDGIAIIGGRWGPEEGANNIRLPAGPGITHANAEGMYGILNILKGSPPP